MTPELEALIDECNSKLRLLGWEIDTLINIESGEKIGGGTKNPK